MASTRLSFLVSTARTAWAQEPSAKPVGGGWATGVALCFIFLWQLLTRLLRLRRQPFSPPTPTVVSVASPSPTSSPQKLGVPAIITDADLGDLIKELEEKNDAEEMWEDVIEQRNDFVSYSAKCSRAKDGPIKYLSTTTFEKCSAELLRDFYMDNEYRKKWDKTVVEHEQLEVDKINALEVGRTIKKFPLLTPREYILAWRLWEGKENSYYCLIKDCEHPLVPRQRKYVRVGYFKSGWRIRKVHGRDACEIKVVHQEDAGLNIKMAKLAFAKGIWNYVGKMNVALRQYSTWALTNSTPKSMLRIVPVPREFETDTDETGSTVPNMANSIASNADWPVTSSRMSAKKWIGKGILLVGGLVCLSRGASTIATQLAVACLLNKLAKQRDTTNQDRDTPKEVPQGRWIPGHSGNFQRSSSFVTDRRSPSHLHTRW